MVPERLPGRRRTGREELGQSREATMLRRPLALVSLVAAAVVAAPGAPPQAATPSKVPVATGFGGAIATVDADATQAGLEGLRRGGNAGDAALAGAPPARGPPPVP